MAFLAWLLRFVLVTVVVNLAWRMLVGRRPIATQGGTRPAQGGSVQKRADGALVRDPQCGTYVVPSRAIRVGSGDHVRYFCSDTCRAAYSAAHPQ